MSANADKIRAAAKKYRLTSCYLLGPNEGLAPSQPCYCAAGALAAECGLGALALRAMTSDSYERQAFQLMSMLPEFSQFGEFSSYTLAQAMRAFDNAWDDALFTYTIAPTAPNLSDDEQYERISSVALDAFIEELQ